MQRLFNGLSADRRLILKIAMHQIFYKRILVMCLIKKRDLLFYIEELNKGEQRKSEVVMPYLKIFLMIVAEITINLSAGIRKMIKNELLSFNP
jgi:hypothetical protein